MRGAVAVLVIVLALATPACVRATSVTCGDGRTCPANTQCDDVHGLCVRDEQVTACATLGDGDACVAGALPGVCDRGYCVEGCGDGRVGYDWARARDEECDDGNYRSHDGCSSECTTELPSWYPWQSPWQPRLNHGAVYDPDRKTIVVFGGTIQTRADDSHWERDRNRTWRQLDIVPRPPVRAKAAMAYDPVRQVVVLFGGRSTSNLADTWEYDGARWVEIATSSAPAARFDAMMWFDTARGTMVLYGGADASGKFGDAWEFDGATWQPIAVTNPPSARSSATVAWDSTRERAIMFGGHPVNDETWEWNGATATWTLISTTGPLGRFSAMMAAVPGTDDIYLYGGTRTVITLGDLWHYNGGTQTWTQIVGPTTPAGRLGASMVFDVALSALVLVGGQPRSDVGLDEVWEYTFNGLWTELTPEFPPRAQVRLVEDESRGELVALIGGNTWVFDASQRWLHAALPPDASLGRRFFGVAYDSVRARVVGFGGESSCTARADTLVWDGTTRTWQVDALPGPPARAAPAMAYDAARDVVVVAGGATSVCPGAEAITDTWELSAGTWTGTGTSPTTAQAVFDPDARRVIAIDWDGTTWVYDGTWSQLGFAAVPNGRFGGLAFNRDRRRVTWYTGVPASQAESGLWELADDGWRQIEVVGQLPPSRFFLGLAAHRASRALVLYGGGGFGTTLGDTWLFSYRSDAPDEICSDGVDNDGDHLVDADDPDCEL